MVRRIAGILLLAFVGVSCSRDPEVVKKKYLQNGNRYFEKGKYKEAYIMYRNAIKKDPKYSEAYYRVGLTEVRMGQQYFLPALRDFERAADTDPNFTNPDARVQAGRMWLSAYISDASRPSVYRDHIRSIANDLLKHDPRSVPGLEFRGYLKLYAEQDTDGAIEQFRLANQISPANPDVMLPLVQALLSERQTAEAEKLGTDLIRQHKDAIAMYDLLYAAYMSQNRVGDAEAILKAKTANNPKEVLFVLQLAQFYYQTQRPAQMQAVIDRLVSNPKQFPLVRLQVGNFYATLRNFDAAIRNFEEGIKQDPEHKAEYQKEIAQVLIVQSNTNPEDNKKPEAARLLTEVLKENPKDQRAESMLATLKIETGDPKKIQEAVSDLQATVGRDPSNPVLRFNLGRALLAKGLPDQARVQFQEAKRLQPAYVPARLALAQLSIVRNDFPTALQEATEILRGDPGNLNAKLLRTSALAALNNMGQARSELEAVLKQYPNTIEAALQLGLLNLREKRYKEAEETFGRLYKANPADLRPLVGLTRAYEVQDQYAKAIDLLQSEIAKNPQRLELRNALANVAYGAKNYDLAVRQYQTIIQARPQAGDIYIRLSQAYAGKNDVQSAVRTCEKATQLRPNDPNAYLQLGMLLEKLGETGKARPAYEQVLKLQPDNAVALNNLAYIVAETGGDLDQALSFAQRARQKLPDNPDVADTLGWIYIRKNLSDNAIDIFRELVSKQPDVSTYRYHLGMALYQRGDKPAARKELQSALEHRPSPQETQKIRELMSKIG